MITSHWLKRRCTGFWPFGLFNLLLHVLQISLRSEVSTRIFGFVVVLVYFLLQLPILFLYIFLLVLLVVNFFVSSLTSSLL